jgi:hypothetical protein
VLVKIEPKGYLKKKKRKEGRKIIVKYCIGRL